MRKGFKAGSGRSKETAKRGLSTPVTLHWALPPLGLSTRLCCAFKASDAFSLVI